jgi:ankyrin repeat protein
VERLIAASADVDKAATDDGSTPLFMAAQEGHTATVAMLLKSGADESIRGFRDRTPLEQAQLECHGAVVALLRA